MKAITKTIWILSLVSLFNDVASEMLLPIMPIYLKTIGFSVLLIGILEGIAEATSGLSKGYFGKLSDNVGKRAVFVRGGYLLSAISKPMMGLFVQPTWVFISRTMDRLGKGIRTGPRDAILSDESEHTDRGKVFGFNRAMDTTGATVGPALALIFLYFHHGEYRTLFYFSFFPGIVAVFLTFLIKDKTASTEMKPKEKVSFFSQFKYWKVSTPAYRQLVIGLLLFALFNSSDAFLILKLKQAGIGDTGVILIYIFYNLVYASLSFPVGILADKVGLKRMLLIGLLVFSMVYGGMAFAATKVVFGLLFLLYGIYYACNEGIAKALISKVCDRKDTGVALGMFAGMQSICVLLASTVAGVIWSAFGSIFVFISAAIISFLVLLFIMFNKNIPG